MKTTRELYLRLVGLFLGQTSDDVQMQKDVKRVIEECFGRGACDP